MSDIASKVITDAEAELEECQMECAAVKDRLEKAREGKCPPLPHLSVRSRRLLGKPFITHARHASIAEYDGPGPDGSEER